MNYRKLKNKELDRKTLSEYKLADKTSLDLILDNVRSLSNIGSVFRVADSFLLNKVHLCNITATPPNKGIQKTALGATETVDWEYHKETVQLIKSLKEQGVSVWSIEQTENSTWLSDFTPNPQEKYAFVLGNEINGVDQEVIDLCDGVIEIPQIGTKHSLNISITAGVVVWDFYQKLNR